MVESPSWLGIFNVCIWSLFYSVVVYLFFEFLYEVCLLLFGRLINNNNAYNFFP